MTKQLLTAGCVILLATGIFASDWNIDQAHSSLGFKVSHLVVSKVKGDFNEFSGTIKFDGEDFEAANVQMSAKVASIDTGNEDRDGHLRGDDFFAVEKYPELTFVSKKVIPGEDGTFQIVGDLTMKGVTKEVTFDCEFNGTVNDPWGNTRAGFSATATIDRREFGLTWNKVLEAGGLTVGNDVEISIEIEAIKAK